MTFRKLIWVMSAAFSLHIIEEYCGGFPSWVTNDVGGAFNNKAFAINNAAFMLIMLGLTLWASLKPSKLAVFLLLAWTSGNLFWDFLFHLAMTAILNRYSPGLITAVALYYPISYFVARAALRDKVIGRSGLAGAYAAGAALMAFVVWYGLFHFAGLPK